MNDQPSKPDIFVISDLHMGDGGPRDNFELGGREGQLHAFVDHVGAEGGELFILGDFFELWQMNLSRLMVKRQRLIEHLLELPLVYVPGNHDVDLVHFVGAKFVQHPLFGHMHLPFERVLGGRRFRFSHGHETDPFNNSEEPGFGRMLAIFAGVFEDQNRSPLLASGETVEAVLEQFGESMLALWTSAVMTMGAIGGDQDVEPSSSLTPAQNPHRLDEHFAEIRADLEKNGYDVAVLGHTHRPGRVGDWYHNSGSWTEDRNWFLRIDPEGHVRHFAWKDGRAIEQVPKVLLGEEKERKRKNPIRAARESLQALFPRPTAPRGSRWTELIQGLLAFGLAVAVAWVLVTHSLSTALILLVSAFGIYGVADGGLVLLAARRQHPTKRLLDRVRGGTSVLLGLVVLVRADTPQILAILIGIWALMVGILRFAAGTLLRRVVDSRWLRLVGIVGIVGGLVLLLMPRVTMMMTWAVPALLGAYGLGEILGGTFGQGRGLALARAGRRRRWFTAAPAPG